MQCSACTRDIEGIESMAKKLNHAAALAQAFESAWQRMISENDAESLRHVNESVFRYFFVSELRTIVGPGACQDEWKRIDLLIRGEREQTAVEFKYFDSRPFPHLKSKTVHFKGKPGAANRGEFTKSLEGLMRLQDNKWYESEEANITERYFVLLGVDRLVNPRLCFSEHYVPDHVKAPADYNLKFLTNRQHRFDGPDEGLFVFGWLARVTE